MSAQIGDEIMIMPQGPDQSVRQGEIREIRNDLGGVVYLVQWSDTHHESLLPHGPDVMIKHRHGRGSGAVAAGATSWLSRLRRPRRHNQDPEQEQHERLAQRVEEIIAGLGLTQTGHSIAGSQIVRTPQVVSVDLGPPAGLDIRILPGQSPDDFSAHTAAIAYDLGVAEVRVVSLGPSLIRLLLVPHESPSGHPPASR